MNDLAGSGRTLDVPDRFRDDSGGSVVDMAGVLHHSGGRDGDPTRSMAVVKAIVTVLLVTAVVAAALGGATYLASRALVGLMS